MFSEYKNSYLQLVCAVNPRVINKAVDRAMWYKRKDMRDEIPPAQYLESMQPSLYAPMTDVTRVQMGFERVGLRVLNRELSSRDSFIQLQAIHSILDQVQISEHAMFLIKLNVVYRLIEILHDRDPIVREKICMILSVLATYYQGREKIMSSDVAIDKLMYLIMKDRKEIRYAAAYTLLSLVKDCSRCTVAKIMTTPDIVENLLKIVKDEYTEIILLHLKTLCALCDWDPEPGLRANGFQIMLTLFRNYDTRIAAKAMDVMSRLCKHNIGKKLADMYDLTYYLTKKFLGYTRTIRILISITALMTFTTQTTRAKWRAKEFAVELTQHLVKLANSHNVPHMQLYIFQILINLCDCPDIRHYLKKHWENAIKNIKIRTHEQWNGTSTSTSYTAETGFYDRTMCIEEVKTVKEEYGEDEKVIHVQSCVRSIQDAKDRLIKAMNTKPYEN